MSRDEARGYLLFMRSEQYESLGQYARAIADLEQALKLYPQSTQAKSNLAWRYAVTPNLTADKRRKALELAQAAVDLEPDCGDFWDSLAGAYAANGDFKRATEYAAQAEMLTSDPEKRGEYRAHRKSFEQGKMVGE
jgi:tetratricopeptide (TPR) repeat protein